MSAKNKTIFIEGVECKECIECSIVKPLSEYYRAGTYKNGEPKYRGRCKICAYENNKETIIARQKEHYENNKETILARNKEHYENNKDTILASQKEHYENNKETVLKTCKAWKDKNKEHRLAMEKLRYIKNKEYIKKQANRYYHENIESQRKIRKNYNILHREKLAAKKRLYYEEHKEEINRKTREDRKLNPDKWKIIDANQAHARRGLGNDCINEPFEGGVFHHLGTRPDGSHDKDTTVCMFVELHTKGKHYIYAPNTGKHGEGMIKKNTEAFLYCIENNPEDAENIEYLYDVMAATIQRTLDDWENANGWAEWVAYKESLIKEMNLNEKETLDYWLQEEASS